MKRIRTALLLSIFVFISTLFWPQLFDQKMVLITLVSGCFLLLIPQLRILAVIPFSALYFTFYASLALTGQPFVASLIANENVLQKSVDGQDHNIIVQVISLISENNKGYFKAKLVELDNDHLNCSPTLEMRWYRSNIALQAGQLHRFSVRFKPVYGRANPGGFDRQKWSYSEHVAYQATVKKHLGKIESKMTLRASFYERVKVITEGLHHQGLMLALSFADKSLIPFAEKKRIRNLGVSHLFAISGLHIGLIFSFVYLLIQYAVNHLLTARKMGWFSLRLINICALIGAFGYAYLAGFSLPTQRAFLMLLVAVFIFSLKRKCFKVDLLLLVLFSVLIWDPLAVLSVSLWLSFGAVAIILMLLWSSPTRIQHQFSAIKTPLMRRIVSYISVLFFLQIGLTVLMLPIQLISFSGLSFVSIGVNLIAIPLFSLLIIPIVLFASLISLLYSPAALLLFTLADQLIVIFFQLTSWLGDSYQFYSLADEKWLIVVFALLLVMVLLHFFAVKMRTTSYLFTLLFLVLLASNYFQKEHHYEQWYIEAIDVGQGLSVLVRTADKALLYDTGARYPSGFNMAESEIIPYLTSLGIKQIDHLFISHSDIDHAGGADIISEHFTVLARWSGEPLRSQYTFKPCIEGQYWRLGTLSIEVLSPIYVTKNNNNNSCVLKISDGTTSLLLTGDIEKKQEKIVVKKYDGKLNSDILFAPHHGSKHSSSDAFIEAVSPKWVIFSAGFMNHWGFPAKEVINRYEKQSVKMLNSGLSGLIRFKISKQTINIETFREDLAPYWYHHSFLP